MRECDLRDASSVHKLLADVQPERIFHLAAQSYVPSSWNSPAETITTNVLGQLNIFEAMRELELDARIQIAGSSEEYGLVHPDEAPITEDLAAAAVEVIGGHPFYLQLLDFSIQGIYGYRF